MDSVFDTSSDVEITAEETYQLALESIIRWTESTSGDWVTRVDAIRRVAQTALDTF